MPHINVGVYFAYKNLVPEIAGYATAIKFACGSSINNYMPHYVPILT